ncbi:hypothetical protein [Enterobacter hormaechei]|uniref:hypothetical protein n=1 Tax=Enterobacter hormaechei TaxID=158836 RepID=UPI0032DAE3C1
MMTFIAGIKGGTGVLLVLLIAAANPFPAEAGRFRAVSLAVPCVPEPGHCVPLNRAGRDCRGDALFTVHTGPVPLNGSGLPVCGSGAEQDNGVPGVIADEANDEGNSER